MRNCYLILDECKYIIVVCGLILHFKIYTPNCFARLTKQK